MFNSLSTTRETPNLLSSHLPLAEITKLELEELKKDPAYSKLVSLLKAAYSGERAAAYAYQGHAESVKDPAVRAKISEIEKQEWEHRRDIGLMLNVLQAAPTAWREEILAVIGKTLSSLCERSPHSLTTFFAKKLEIANVKDYREASILADRLGLEEMARRLIEMADTEQEHVNYFTKLLK